MANPFQFTRSRMTDDPPAGSTPAYLSSEEGWRQGKTEASVVATKMVIGDVSMIPKWMLPHAFEEGRWKGEPTTEATNTPTADLAIAVSTRLRPVTATLATRAPETIKISTRPRPSSIIDRIGRRPTRRGELGLGL